MVIKLPEMTAKVRQNDRKIHAYASSTKDLRSMQLPRSKCSSTPSALKPVNHHHIITVPACNVDG